MPSGSLVRTPSSRLLLNLPDARPKSPVVEMAVDRLRYDRPPIDPDSQRAMRKLFLVRPNGTVTGMFGAFDRAV